MGDLSNQLHAIAARLQMRVGEALETEAGRRGSTSGTKGENSPLWRLLRSGGPQGRPARVPERAGRVRRAVALPRRGHRIGSGQSGQSDHSGHSVWRRP